jgi:predicted nicotinamide N-methyase
MPADVIGAADPNWDIVTAGDVCYEREMAQRVVPWLRTLAARGCLVLLGDPGRAYLPVAGLAQRARYLVPTSRELEDRDVRETVIWEVLPG